MIENEAVDPRIPEQRLQPREADGVVGAQQFLHDDEAGEDGETVIGWRGGGS